MKHYYYYIEAGSQIDATSHFYKVGVGTGPQATRDYLFLLAHSVDHQHYFEKVSSSADDFLLRVARSLNREHIIDLDMIHTDARSLVRAIKSGVQLYQSQYVLDATDKLRCMTSLSYRIAAAIRP